MSLTISAPCMSQVSAACDLSSYPSHYLTNMVSFPPNSLSKPQPSLQCLCPFSLGLPLARRTVPRSPQLPALGLSPLTSSPLPGSHSCQGQVLPSLQLPSTKTHPPSCLPSQVLESVRLTVLSHSRPEPGGQRDA